MAVATKQIEAKPDGPSRLGIFEPLEDGRAYLVDEIEGQLPDGLRGTLYRNGPGKNLTDGESHNHVFDGDGMLSQFTLDGKSVRYRNRFVRTNHYLGESTAKARRFRGVGTQRPGGAIANAFRRPTNVANTSVSFHGGNLLALWEGGRPWRLDPDTLETLGEHDFDGRLRGGHWFSAHPKLDPLTGQLFNFGMRYGPRTSIRTYRVDAKGRLDHLSPVPLPFSALNHDFAITEKHLVFVIAPVKLLLGHFILGRANLLESARWKTGDPTRVILIPRDGSPAKIAECDPFFHFHIGNAFEQDGDTVVDLCAYEDWDTVVSGLRSFTETDTRVDPTFERLRVSPSGRVSLEQQGDWHAEFPQLDQRVNSLPQRYTYASGHRAQDRSFQSLLKIDHGRDTVSTYDFGDDSIAGEPIFVPRSNDAAEDDGWLLSVIYSNAKHRSRLVILDARDLESGPIAVAHLRHHIPFGFHGTFTERVAS